MKLEDAIDLLYAIYLVEGDALPDKDTAAIDAVIGKQNVKPLVLRSAMIPYQLNGPIFNAWMVLKEEADRRAGRDLMAPS